MITLGKRYDLTVVKVVDFGYYLDAGELGEVLLPRKLAGGTLLAGECVNVMLYLDSDDLPIATTQRARAEVGQFAYLKVVAETGVGAFLDWGLDKDLLVPFAEQHRKMEVGRSYLVYIYLDPTDGRIVASSRVDRFLDDDRPHRFKPGQPVELIIANSTDLGFKAIINHGHWGVLYKDEVEERLSFGQTKRGFIKYVRPDGRIDLTLKGGKVTRDKNAERVLDYLRAHDGFAPLHDKSPPQLIMRELGLSKAAFKKAIGGLYKQRLITLGKDGIRRVES